MVARHGPRPLGKQVTFNTKPDERYDLPHDPGERCLTHLAWYKNLTQREATIKNGGGFRASLPETICGKLDGISDPLRKARVIALLLRMELVGGYRADIHNLDDIGTVHGVAAKASSHNRPFRRVWLYDTGAAQNVIGLDNLSEADKCTIIMTSPPNLFYS